jgi:hypothetical protein
MNLRPWMLVALTIGTPGCSFIQVRKADPLRPDVTENCTEEVTAPVVDLSVGGVLLGVSAASLVALSSLPQSSPAPAASAPGSFNSDNSNLSAPFTGMMVLAGAIAAAAYGLVLIGSGGYGLAVTGECHRLKAELRSKTEGSPGARGTSADVVPAWAVARRSGTCRPPDSDAPVRCPDLGR